MRQQLGALGFSSWLKSLNGFQADEQPKKPLVPEAVHFTRNYETILSLAHFDYWLEKLKQAELFAIDTETTSLNYSEAQIVGLSFAVEAGQAAYLPLAHDYADAPAQLDRAQVLKMLKPLLEDVNKAKLGQNLKYDAHVLANHGIHLQGIRHDTMLESYVLNSTATKHNMDDLAKHYLGIDTIHYQDVAGKGAKQIGFQEVPIHQAAEYAAEDADITLRLHLNLSDQLKQLPLLWKLYNEIEIPLVDVLTRIEENGVLIDIPCWPSRVSSWRTG